MIGRWRWIWGTQADLAGVVASDESILDFAGAEEECVDLRDI